MYDNVLKEINKKYTIGELFTKIKEVLSLSKEEQKTIEEALLKKSRGTELITNNQKIISKVLDDRVSSVVYQILRHNNIEVLKLLRNYQKKINRGSKPDKIVKESSSKIRTIIEVLKNKKVVFLNEKGLSLDQSFREALLKALELTRI